MSSHIVPASVYVKNAIVLGVLMVATVLAAYMHFTPPFGTIVAVVIAIAKTTCVILFFMNVLYSSKLTKVFVATAFFFLIILFGIIVLDFISRTWLTPAIPWS